MTDAEGYVKDASAATLAAWVTFLSLETFLAVAVISTTDLQMLLQEKVPLPLVGVSLPIPAFFAFAPTILVTLHAYLLLHVSMLASRLELMHSTEKSGEFVDRLPPSILTFSLLDSGGAFLRSTIFRALSWFSVVIAPILLLLAFQVRYLPNHEPGVTWLHRGLIVADLLLLLTLFPRRLTVSKQSFAKRVFRDTLLALLASGVVLFSVAVATFPIGGESRADWWTAPLPWLRQSLFEGEVNAATGLPETLFSNSLVIVNTQIGNKDAEQLDVQRFRGRDLTKAVFFGSDLSHADLSGANLTDANFRNTRLKGTRFGCIRKLLDRRRSEYGDTRPGDSGPTDSEVALCSTLVRTDFNGATLDGASFSGLSTKQRLEARHLSFDGTSIERTSFKYVMLDGASFRLSKIRDTSFTLMRMRDTDFGWAQIFGGAFNSVNLAGAFFRSSSIALSKFSNVSLDNADFRDSNLAFLDFTDASLIGTDFSAAKILNVGMETSRLDAPKFNGALVAFSEIRPEQRWFRSSSDAFPGAMRFNVGTQRPAGSLPYLRAVPFQEMDRFIRGVAMAQNVESRAESNSGELPSVIAALDHIRDKAPELVSTERGRIVRGPVSPARSPLLLIRTRVRSICDRPQSIHSADDSDAAIGDRALGMIDYLEASGWDLGFRQEADRSIEELTVVRGITEILIGRQCLNVDDRSRAVFLRLGARRLSRAIVIPSKAAKQHAVRALLRFGPSQAFACTFFITCF